MVEGFPAPLHAPPHPVTGLTTVLVRKAITPHSLFKFFTDVHILIKQVAKKKIHKAIVI
jgi:hypothetical protein